MEIAGGMPREHLLTHQRMFCVRTVLITTHIIMNRLFAYRTIIICIHRVLQKNIYGLQQHHCYASKLWSITIQKESCDSLSCCKNVQGGLLTICINLCIV